MPRISLEGLKKIYGNLEVIHGINLDIKPGELVVFVGPSGCGKSTLLRMIAGLEEISSGVLRFDEEIVNTRTPLERGIAMVFQSYALYPYMTVRENIGFGLKLARHSKADIKTAVERVAAMLKLDTYLNRKPMQLSGGQRQRVAIGRAIVRNPSVFLFDEPLSNLDAALRAATRIEIANLHARMPDVTMIYVTHDQIEAMTLADRIVVLNSGRVEQIGTPMELYLNPANLFVACFLGSPAMNILPCRADSSGLVSLTHGGGVVKTRSRISGDGYVGVRPEDLIITNADPLLIGTIELVEQLGESQQLYVNYGGVDPLIVKAARELYLERGTKIGLAAASQRIHIFDKDGNAVIRS